MYVCEQVYVRAYVLVPVLFKCESECMMIDSE
jgi:hypothetical protein